MGWGPFGAPGLFLCVDRYMALISKRCLKSSFPDCILCQSLSGTGTARSSFGPPTPRGRLKFGRMLACRTRTARNRRVKDVRRSVAGPLSAASARYLPIGGSDFGAVKPRFIEMATYNRSQTCCSSEFPPRIYSEATGVKSLCNQPRFLGFHTGKPENTTLKPYEGGGFSEHIFDVTFFYTVTAPPSPVAASLGSATRGARRPAAMRSAACAAPPAPSLRLPGGCAQRRLRRAAFAATPAPRRLTPRRRARRRLARLRLAPRRLAREAVCLRPARRLVRT
jgi:hypothetical protein